MEMNQIFRHNSEAVRSALVGIILPDSDADSCDVSLDELSRLLDTAGGVEIFRITQPRQSPDPSTYIGQGKLLELKTYCDINDVELAVFDCELSASQINNISKALGDIFVIDRSMLILDIFALHAKSAEGKLQVELAQLKYTIPRLYGTGKDLSRLGGGIGTRGPGETKLETDKRHIKRRIAALTEQLENIDKNRGNHRSRRLRSSVKQIAIAGYTNAGKSTLLNYLTGAGILAEDKLFATLDTTTRKYRLPGGQQILLTDTVGFIDNLPHHLISAFRSTLEEVRYADIILIIIDASDPACSRQLEVTEDLLRELDAASKPVLYVFNKCDSADIYASDVRTGADKNKIVFISAKTGSGVDLLLSKLEALINEDSEVIKFRVPRDMQSVIAKMYSFADVIDVNYSDDGDACIIASVDNRIKGMFREYIINDDTETD